MEKLTKTFNSGDILEASTMTSIVDTLNSIIDILNEIIGAIGSTSAATSAIDNINEMKSLFEGIDNTKRLKDALGGGTVGDDGIVRFDI